MFKVKDIKVGTYNNYYKRNIQLQFLNDENFTQFMQYLCESGSNYQQVLKDYCNKFNIDTQGTDPNTAVLNAIGGLLGLPPIDYFSVEVGDVLTPITADEYILLIKGQQLKNTWDGTNQGILNALNELFPEYEWTLYDSGNMEITIKMGGENINPVILGLFEQGWFTPNPIAVTVRLREYAHNNGYTVEYNGTTTEYANFSTAMTNALQNSGSKVTLYNDAQVETTYALNNLELTIDTNGYNLDFTPVSNIAAANPGTPYRCFYVTNASGILSIINSYNTKGKIKGLTQSNLNFITTGSSGNILIENASIENNTYGTLLSISLNINKTCIFNNVSFLGNNGEISNSSVTYNNCEFVSNVVGNNKTLIVGGTINNSKFTNNSIGSSSKLINGSTISGCVFNSNSGTTLVYHNPSSSAAISITNSVFYNNNVGSVLYLDNDTITVIGCNFYNNTISNYGIYKGTGTGTISNCNFYSNTTANSGNKHLIYFYIDNLGGTTKRVTLSNVNIYNNTGFEYIIRNLYGIGLSDVEIYNNSAKYVLYVLAPLYVGSNVNIHDNTVTISNCYQQFDGATHNPYLTCETFTGSIPVTRNPATGQVTENYGSTTSTGTIISEAGLTVTVGAEVSFS